MLIEEFRGEYVTLRSILLTPIAATVLLLCFGESSSAFTGFEHPAFARQTPEDSHREILFQALDEIENRRFQEGRALLAGLLNRDDQFVLVAKLIFADSYYREGGVRNLERAELEYRDLLELFPEDQLAPRIMVKIAEIYWRLIPTHHAYVSFTERILLKLRDRFPAFESSEAMDYFDAAQEILADHHLKIARFYLDRRESPAAVLMRCEEIVKKRPRYSRMDEALWLLANAEEAEENVEERKEQAIEHYRAIVRDHPNSAYRNLAESRLRSLGVAVPEPSPGAGVDQLERSARVAGLLADLQGPNAKPRGRGILLDEWDQVDWALLHDLIREAERQP